MKIAIEWTTSGVREGLLARRQLGVSMERIRFILAAAGKLRMQLVMILALTSFFVPSREAARDQLPRDSEVVVDVTCPMLL